MEKKRKRSQPQGNSIDTTSCGFRGPHELDPAGSNPISCGGAQEQGRRN